MNIMCDHGVNKVSKTGKVWILLSALQTLFGFRKWHDATSIEALTANEGTGEDKRTSQNKTTP